MTCISFHKLLFLEPSEGHKVESGYKDYNYDDDDEEAGPIHPGYLIENFKGCL